MQAFETAFGLLLLLLIGLALMSAVMIVVLIEFAWIVRLAARLYWRWRSSVNPPDVAAEQRDQAEQDEDPPTRCPDPTVHSNGTLGPPLPGGPVHDRGVGGDHPQDKGE
jgi:hypothetical protein